MKRAIEHIKDIQDATKASLPYDGVISEIFINSVNVRPVGQTRAKTIRNVALPEHIDPHTLRVGLPCKLGTHNGKPIVTDILTEIETIDYSGVGKFIPTTPVITDVTPYRDTTGNVWYDISFFVPDSEKEYLTGIEVFYSDNDNINTLISYGVVSVSPNTITMRSPDNKQLWFAARSVAGLNYSPLSSMVTSAVPDIFDGTYQDRFDDSTVPIESFNGGVKRIVFRQSSPLFSFHDAPTKTCNAGEANLDVTAQNIPTPSSTGSYYLEDGLHPVNSLTALPSLSASQDGRTYLNGYYEIGNDPCDGNTDPLTAKFYFLFDLSSAPIDLSQMFSASDTGKLLAILDYTVPGNCITDVTVRQKGHTEHICITSAPYDDYHFEIDDNGGYTNVSGALTSDMFTDVEEIRVYFTLSVDVNALDNNAIRIMDAIVLLPEKVVMNENIRPPDATSFFGYKILSLFNYYLYSSIEYDENFNRLSPLPHTCDVEQPTSMNPSAYWALRVSPWAQQSGAGTTWVVNKWSDENNIDGLISLSMTTQKYASDDATVNATTVPSALIAFKGNIQMFTDPSTGHKKAHHSAYVLKIFSLSSKTHWTNYEIKKVITNGFNDITETIVKTGSLPAPIGKHKNATIIIDTRSGRIDKPTGHISIYIGESSSQTAPKNLIYTGVDNDSALGNTFMFAVEPYDSNDGYAGSSIYFYNIRIGSPSHAEVADTAYALDGNIIAGRRIVRYDIDSNTFQYSDDNGNSWTTVQGDPTSNTAVDWADVQNKPDTATRWADWTEITSKPAVFPPDAHTHSHGDISDWSSAWSSEFGTRSTDDLAEGTTNKYFYTHALDGAEHAGDLPWARVDKTGGSLADLPIRSHSDLQNINPDDHHDPVTAGDGIAVSGQRVSVDSSVVRTSRLVSAGDGLSGGGDLSADRTLSLDVAHSNHWTARQYFDGGLDASDAEVYGQLHASVFVKDLISAHAGEMIIAKSAGTIKTDFSPATVGNTATLEIKDPPTGSASLFEVDDILRIQSENNNGVSEFWLKVTAVTGNTYTVETLEGSVISGTLGTVIPAGTGVVDYGQASDGLIVLDADGADTPKINLLTHSGAPQTSTELKTRIGNLSGIPSYTDGLGSSIQPQGYGLYAETAYITDGSYITNLVGTNIQANTITATQVNSDFLTLGNGTGVVLNDVSLYLPFTYAGGNRANTNGHLGQAPTTESGSVVGVAGGQFGSGTVSLTEGFTNLVTNPVFRTHWAMEWNAGKGVRTLETDNPPYDQHYCRVKITSSTTGDSYGTRTANDIPVTAGETYKFSFFARGTAPVINYLYIMAGSGNTYISPIAITNEWQGYSFEYTASATENVGILCALKVGANGVQQDDYVDIDGWQVTHTPYQLPFRYGDMPGCEWSGAAHASTTVVSLSNLLYENVTKNLTEFTIGTWVYVDDIHTGYNHIASVFSTWSDRWTLYMSNGLSVQLYVANSADTNTPIVTASAPYGLTRGWHHIALVAKNLYGTDIDATIYIDGVGTTGTHTATAGLNVGNSKLGVGVQSSRPLNGSLADFFVAKTALSASTIKSIYDSGVPVTVPHANHEILIAGDGGYEAWINASGMSIGDSAHYVKYDATNGLTIAGDGNGITNIDGGNIVTGSITANQVNSDFLTLGSGAGVVLNDVSLYLPFTYAGGYKTNTNGHLGQAPVVENGSIVGLEDGRFGSGSVSLVMSFNNYCTDPSFEVIPVGAHATTSAETSIVKYGTQAVRITGNGDGSSDAYADVIGKIDSSSFSDGDTITVSVYGFVEEMFSPTDTQRGLRITVYTYNSSSGAYTRFLSNKIDTEGEWNLLSVKVTIPSGDVLKYVRLYLGDDDTSRSVIYDGLQVTKTSYRLPFRYYGMQGVSGSYGTISTVSQSNLAYDKSVINPRAGTISFWMRLPFDVPNAGLNDWGRLFEIGSYTSPVTKNAIRCQTDTDYSTVRFYYANKNNGTTYLAYTNTPTDGDWHLFTFTWEDGQPIRIYKDGVLEMSSGAIEAFDTFLDTDTFGIKTNANVYNAVEYSDFLIAKTALSSDTIKSIYDSGVPVVVPRANHEILVAGDDGARVWLNADGLFAEDDSGKPSFALVNKDGLSWNGETLDTRDVLLGDNSSGKANILFDASAGTFSIRGGTTEQVKIASDGSITANAGDLVINKNGITVYATVDSGINDPTAGIKWYDKTNSNEYLGGIYGFKDNAWKGITVYSPLEIRLRTGGSNIVLDTSTGWNGTSYFPGASIELSAQPANIIRVKTESFNIISDVYGTVLDFFAHSGIGWYLDVVGVVDARDGYYISGTQVIDSNGEWADDTGWITPTLEDGWTHWNTGSWQIQYRRIGKIVQVRGLGKWNNASDSGKVVFYLPPSCRPPKNNLWMTMQGDPGYLYGRTRLDVRTDGGVWIQDCRQNTWHSVTCTFMVA